MSGVNLFKIRPQNTILSPFFLYSGHLCQKTTLGWKVVFFRNTFKGLQENSHRNLTFWRWTLTQELLSYAHRPFFGGLVIFLLRHY